MANILQRLFNPSSKRAILREQLPFWEWMGRTYSKVNVTEDTSLQLTAVARCVDIISGTIAKLNLHLYKVTANGKELDVNNSLYSLINSQPNKYYNSFNYDRLMLSYRVLYGNAYAYIKRDKYMNVVELIPLYPWAVQPRITEGVIWYYNNDFRYPDIPKLLKPYEIIHLRNMTLDGLVGKSPITMHAETLGVSIAAENYGAKFFGNSAIPTGYLKSVGDMNAEKADRWKASWKKSQGGDNQGDVAILGGGAEYVKISVSPEEAQFLQTKKYGKLEIANIFGVPPHKLADLDRATFSNIEEQNISFVDDTLSIYAAEIESEYRQKLLKESEKNNMFFAYDFSKMLQGNSKDQAETLSKLISTGLISINEGRFRLNLNSVDGGDERYMQMSYMPINQMPQYFASQINSQQKREFVEKILKQIETEDGN